MLRNKFMSTSWEIALKWMQQNTFDDKSILVQVIIWCRQAAIHYWANVDINVCCHMTLIGHNELTLEILKYLAKSRRSFSMLFSYIRHVIQNYWWPRIFLVSTLATDGLASLVIRTPVVSVGKISGSRIYRELVIKTLTSASALETTQLRRRVWAPDITVLWQIICILNDYS